MASDKPIDWRPTAAVSVLQLRAQIVARVRQYFASERVLEVETPILARAGTTDPHLHSFSAHSLAPGDKVKPYYLHTSPEFAMKRLLAAGSGSIYQIAKVFRGGERGGKHNPEFTMLEWYRVGFDHFRLMQDAEHLIRSALDNCLMLEPSEKLTYAEAFEQYAGLNPHAASTDELRRCAEHHGIAVSGLRQDDNDSWQNLLLTHVVEPHLGNGPRCTFIYDYPASQAALARIRAGAPSLAERFELYIAGVELANGFHELADADEQRRRFEADGFERKKQHLPDIPTDELLLSALEHGLPECSGVALGLDRLVMLAAKTNDIADTIAFPIDRA